MKPPNSDDIQIGDDEWITFNELDWLNIEAVELDPMLGPVMDFLINLEHHCFAECCGFDAFTFHADDIRQVAIRFNVDELIKHFESLVEHVKHSNEIAYSSDRMNNLIEKQTLISLFQHIIETIRSTQTTKSA